MEYHEMKELGIPVSCRSLAKRAKVGRSFAAKIINDIESGMVNFGTPERPNLPQGPGSKTLTPTDELVLLSVYYGNLKAVLTMYQWKLFHITGLFISKTTISHWLQT